MRLQLADVVEQVQVDDQQPGDAESEHDRVDTVGIHERVGDQRLWEREGFKEKISMRVESRKF